MNEFENYSDTQKLELIFDYINKLNRSQDVESSLMILADMGRDLVSAERCTIWLLDGEDKLYSKVAHGVDLLEMSSKVGIVGECIKTGKSLLINDSYNDKRFNSEVDAKTGFKTKSILVQPLFDSNKKIIGAIQALNKKNEGKNFTSEDEKILSVAGAFSAKNLDTLKLNVNLIRAQKETITLLGELCEKRSLETGKHTARVSLYSKVIAQNLGLDQNDINLLVSAAALHDIGKLSVPDRILLKPGKLTEEEYKQMQTHSEIGFKMLEKSESDLLRLSAIISHQHHEKYNGTGYPQKLKGEEIHIFARIVALSDVFDAITSKRCYKDAWSMEESYQLLRDEKGKHFDPDVVDAFFQSIDEIEKIYKIYREV